MVIILLDFNFFVNFLHNNINKDDFTEDFFYKYR